VKALFLLFVSAALVNNFVLQRFLGLCPFFGVSKKIETAIGMGLAVVFVMVLASVVTWGIWNYVLVPNSLDYLKTVAYILVIASLVQLTEMFLMKNNPSLYQALGVFLPLITTNCAILGITIINTQDKNYGLPATIVHAVGAGLGFTLALILMAGIRERLDIHRIPKSLEGFPIAFITAGLMAMAFLGFSGMITE